MDWKELIAIAAGHGKAAGLTQTEIARRTGAHQKQISQLAAGKVEPRFGFALRFFEAVGLRLTLIPIPPKQCPEFPYFGASYPDARCIDGQLYDLDKCDENGNLYDMGDYHPCPFCNTEEFVQIRVDDGVDESAAQKWVDELKTKYDY